MMDRVASIVINRYKFELINNQPKIIIEQVKLLGKDGKYIKFAKLEEVIDVLHLYPVSFRQRN